MGEEIGWRSLAGEILCARERLDQCADIGDEGRIVAVEESLYIRQIGIEREIRCRRERSSVF